jgi:hypothetical protein
MVSGPRPLRSISERDCHFKMPPSAMHPSLKLNNFFQRQPKTFQGLSDRRRLNRSGLFCARQQAFRMITHLYIHGQMYLAGTAMLKPPEPRNVRPRQPSPSRVFTARFARFESSFCRHDYRPVCRLRRAGPVALHCDPNAVRSGQRPGGGGGRTRSRRQWFCCRRRGDWVLHAAV